MHKKRLKVALVLLNAIKTKYPETKQFIDDTMAKGKDICQRGIFFTSLKAKS